MKPLFLTEVKTHSAYDGETFWLEAKAGKWLGKLEAKLDRDQALIKIDCGDEALALLLLVTGARQALYQMKVQAVVMRKPESALLPLIKQAGYLKTDQGWELPFDLDFNSRGVKVVLVGGVVSSREVMRAMIRRGAPPVLAVGYSRAKSDLSGYVDLDPLCEDNSIQLIKTEDVNAPDVVEAVTAAKPDYICVFGWSQLLSPELLAAARVGCLGMHPTKLPDGRGRAPIPWTLIKGMTESAQSLFWLAEQADEGELADQRPFTIDRTDNALTLYDKIVRVQMEQVEEALPMMAVGTLSRVKQDLSQGEVWLRRRPEDGVIDWRKPAEELYNWVRGLTHPYPGAFTSLHSRKLYVWHADLIDGFGLSKAEPGTVVGLEVGAGHSDGAILVTCGDGRLLALRRVQFQGGDQEGGYRLHEAGQIAVGMRFDT